MKFEFGTFFFLFGCICMLCGVVDDYFVVLRKCLFHQYRGAAWVRVRKQYLYKCFIFGSLHIRLIKSTFQKLKYKTKENKTIFLEYSNVPPPINDLNRTIRILVFAHCWLFLTSSSECWFLINQMQKPHQKAISTTDNQKA